MALREICVGSDYLATSNNYHLTRKNASFHLVILHRHLWGGIFQMAGVGERQVTSGEWQGAFRLRGLDMHL